MYYRLFKMPVFSRRLIFQVVHRDAGGTFTKLTRMLPMCDIRADNKAESESPTMTISCRGEKGSTLYAQPGFGMRLPSFHNMFF